MSYRRIKSTLNSLDNPPKDVGPLIASGTTGLTLKGYGSPEMELKFLHKLFLYIRSCHEGFESISWQQSNAYNDEYHHIQLFPFIVNKELEIDSDITFFFKYYKGEEMNSKINFSQIEGDFSKEIEYAKSNQLEHDEDGLIHQKDMESFWDSFNQRYSFLKTPCLKFLVLLKILESEFSMYYFLYVFGNGVEVEFNNLSSG